MEISGSVSHSAVCSAYRQVSASSSAHRPCRRQKPKPVGLSGRCHAVLKQHKTRLYIVGRCVSMLLCWHGHDSD
uniref:Uncharacterized protein n=1 Tax=Arundo donax TaxID=35708 RepID=A0A0A8Z6I3_ARUDO